MARNGRKTAILAGREDEYALCARYKYKKFKLPNRLFHKNRPPQDFIRKTLHLPKKRRKLSQVKKKKSRPDIKKCRVSKDILWRTIYLVNTSTIAPTKCQLSSPFCSLWTWRIISETFCLPCHSTISTFLVFFSFTVLLFLAKASSIQTKGCNKVEYWTDTHRFINNLKTYVKILRMIRLKGNILSLIWDAF